MNLLQFPAVAFEQTQHPGVEFMVLDLNRQPIGHAIGVAAQPPAKPGLRWFGLFDAQARPVLWMDDVFKQELHHVRIYDGAGVPLAQVWQEKSAGKRVIQIAMGDGQRLQMTGGANDIDNAVTGPRGQYAYVTRNAPDRSWPTCHTDRYLAYFQPHCSPVERQAVLGSVLMLDAVRGRDPRMGPEMLLYLDNLT